MTQMICPYCEQPLGIQGNRFQFEIVSFVLGENKSKDKKQEDDQKTHNLCAIYCENCGKVLGLTP